MALEPIHRRNPPEPDRAEVEQRVIASVEADPERFLAAYSRHPDSFGGRYVCADLFKEMFEDYSANREARGRYNGVVHNAAAVLSAEQFRRVLTIHGEPEKNTANFLTGVPGAGKTSSIITGGNFPPDMAVVFEGQLAKPETSIAKIKQAINVGFHVTITVVHALPENALANTFRRFNKIGRGAGIGVMADIQGGLPDGMRALEREFGDKVQLKILDVRDSLNPQWLIGWQNVLVLETEGNREQIYERLFKALEAHRAAGFITEDCYRQAVGIAPFGQHRSLDGANLEGRKEDVRGRRISLPDRETPVVEDGGQKAVTAPSIVQRALAAVRHSKEVGRQAGKLEPAKISAKSPELNPWQVRQAIQDRPEDRSGSQSSDGSEEPEDVTRARELARQATDAKAAGNRLSYREHRADLIRHVRDLRATGRLAEIQKSHGGVVSLIRAVIGLGGRGGKSR